MKFGTRALRGAAAGGLLCALFCVLSRGGGQGINPMAAREHMQISLRRLRGILPWGREESRNRLETNSSNFLPKVRPKDASGASACRCAAWRTQAS